MNKSQYSIKKNYPKTLTGYTIEALDFFKTEYAKTKTTGLEYDYPLRDHPKSRKLRSYTDGEMLRIKAIENLVTAGIITDFMITWDHAICTLNEKKLLKKQVDSKFSIEKPKIYYNPETGRGIINDHKFKFKDHQPEYRVFKVLYENINNRVLRYTILVQAHFYEEGEDIDTSRKVQETNTINSIAKTIREKTGLNTEQLVLNNGNLTLIGIRD